MINDSMKSEDSRSWLPIAWVVALWTPAMIAASHEWSHGLYYDYGWIVPPVALWLLLRRWNDLPGEIRMPGSRVVLGFVLVLVPWFVGLRILSEVDPSWRMPVGLCGLTAALVTHALLAKTRGLQASFGFLWITLFLASALPLPVETTAPAQPATHAARGFWLQLGAFARREGAVGFQQRVAREAGWLAPLMTIFNERQLHRLQAGPYASRADATSAARQLRDALQLVPAVVERR